MAEHGFSQHEWAKTEEAGHWHKDPSLSGQKLGRGWLSLTVLHRFS